MISLPAGSRIWLVAGITDMREMALTARHQKFRTS